MRRMRAGPYLAQHPTPLAPFSPVGPGHPGVRGRIWWSIARASPATSANGADCEIQPPAMLQSGCEVVSRCALQAPPIAVAECSLMIVINVLPSRGRKDEFSGVNASRWRLSFPSSRLRDGFRSDSSTYIVRFHLINAYGYNFFIRGLILLIACA